VPLDQLLSRASDVRLPLELAHRAAGMLGKLVLAAAHGPVLIVDPARTVEQIESDYSAAMLAEARRLLDAMSKIRLTR
jgi:hypothetical protein